ncbi:MAG: outer membrane protein transport protein [Deltaproteobacteria bacterium]|nr:outer membrane protein transport protein [Deltaproteobacteria bacterium]
MKNFIRIGVTCLLALWVGLGTSEAFATGYYLGELDAAAVGRSLAVTAKLEEPSTIFFNPAGMAYLKGFNASLGGTVVYPEFDYSDPVTGGGSCGALREAVIAPHLYATYTFGEVAALGVGFNNPFGLSLKWPEGFQHEDQIAAIKLQMPTIYIGGAYRPIPELAVGATLRIVAASLEMLQRIQLPSKEFDTLEYGFNHLGASAVGVGASVGIALRPIEKLHIGIAYNSRIKFNFKNGDNHFGLPEGTDDTSDFHDQGGLVTMTTPDIISFGVGYDVLDNLYLEFDFNYTLWSVFKDLTVLFDNDPKNTLTEEGAAEKNWKNTPTFRLGALYRPLSYLAVRLGGGYDQTPVPDETMSPDLPDASRVFVAAGLGYLYEPLGLKLNVAYQFVYFLDRTVPGGDKGKPPPATYSSMAHLILFTAGFHY